MHWRPKTKQRCARHSQRRSWLWLMPNWHINAICMFYANSVGLWALLIGAAGCRALLHRNIMYFIVLYCWIDTNPTARRSSSAHIVECDGYELWRWSLGILYTELCHESTWTSINKLVYWKFATASTQTSVKSLVEECATHRARAHVTRVWNRESRASCVTATTSTGWTICERFTCTRILKTK